MIQAVNVAIINANNQALLAKRAADKPMPNSWEFPGGKVEANESLEDCAIREIQEELDVDIEVGEYLGSEKVTFEGKQFQLHLFTATLKDAHQTLTLSVHSEAKWLHYEDFPDEDFPAKSLSFTKALAHML
jgi:8-oxo-dGTP diphosphatase